MRDRSMRVFVLGIALGLSGAALAEEAQAGDDATITVVADGETPDDIVNLIELPGAAAAKAGGTVSRAAEAQQQAGQAAREFGQSVADEARNSGIGEAVREEARQQAHDDNDPNDGRRGPPAH
jgi:hypothetical protein